MISLNTKVIGILSIIIVVGLTFSIISIYPLSSLPANTDTLGISGYGVIKAYSSDGTLFYEWEGHNDLTQDARNLLSLCAAIDASYCNSIFPITRIGIASPTFATDTQNLGIPITNTTIPEGCVSDCIGWRVETTFDLNFLSGPDEIVTILTGNSYFFNELWPKPIQVQPGDRLIITVTFEIL